MIDLQKMPILAKKIILSDEAHFDLGRYETSKIVAFGVQKTRTHTLKSRCTQSESLLGADFGEIQLHTIDDVVKNWTDRVGYCMASRGSHLNEIILHYCRLYFQIKKEIWENIQ